LSFSDSALVQLQKFVKFIRKQSIIDASD